MTRDIKLVRKILLEVEMKGIPDNWMFPEVEGYSKYEISYHIKILTEAGCL